MLAEDLEGEGLPFEKYFLAGQRFVDLFVDDRGRCAVPASLCSPGRGANVRQLGRAAAPRRAGSGGHPRMGDLLPPLPRPGSAREGPLQEGAGCHCRAFRRGSLGRIPSADLTTRARRGFRSLPARREVVRRAAPAAGTDPRSRKRAAPLPPPGQRKAPGCLPHSFFPGYGFTGMPSEHPGSRPWTGPSWIPSRDSGCFCRQRDRVSPEEACGACGPPRPEVSPGGAFPHLPGRRS